MSTAAASIALRALLAGTAVTAAVILTAAAPASPGAPAPPQSSFTRSALADRLRATRVESYAVNVRIRPLLLFWISRDDVGEATVTWREGADQHKAYEFLIGSDPERVPRNINRWGFIVEELNGDHAEVLGIMRESGEQTLEEAKAKVEGEGTLSTFKAARTSISGNRAVSGVITLQAPSHLTYRDVDEVLALVPGEAPERKTIDLPEGTRKGFLVALEGLLHASVDACQGGNGNGARNVPAMRYLYNQNLFDLSLESCAPQPSLRTKAQTFNGVIDGRFRLKNLSTKNAMTFHIAYGAAGTLRSIPVRMTFRPRWWMEVELELARSPAARLTSAGPLGQ